MPWIMVYVTIAVTVLSVAGAWCAKGLRRDPARLAAIVAAAALWPVLVVGVVQFGAVHLYATVLRRRAAPVPAVVAPEPTPKVLVDSLVRMAQQVGAKHPA